MCFASIAGIQWYANQVGDGCSQEEVSCLYTVVFEYPDAVAGFKAGLDQCIGELATSFPLFSKSNSPVPMYCT